MCLKVTRPVLRISRSFEGHCALTNGDEANEVQQNVVTAKKGKKRGIKAMYITSFQVNNLTCNSKCWLVLFYWEGWISFFFIFLEGGGGCWSKLFPWGKIYIVLLSAIVSALPSPVTINERGILNLIPCENKGNRAHVVNNTEYKGLTKRRTFK